MIVFLLGAHLFLTYKTGFVQRKVFEGIKHSFGQAMRNLKPFKDVIYEHINDDKPFLGICLGQQILLSSSEEAEGVKGLDLFKGK